MTIKWKTGEIRRLNMNNELMIFRTYTAESFPGWRIEKWEPGIWATFDSRDVFCNTRETLSAAKEVLASLATH